MGDGSTPGELLASAHRLLGVTDSLGGRSFLQHVLLVAAIDIEVGDPDDHFEPQAYRSLKSAKATFTQGIPRPGDVAFLRSSQQGYLHGAVVEAVDATGKVWLIGEVSGTVQRFELPTGGELVAYGRP